MFSKDKLGIKVAPPLKQTGLLGLGFRVYSAKLFIINCETY